MIRGRDEKFRGDEKNIASNWDQISDMKDAKPCYQGGEQAMKMFELIQNEKG